MNRISRLPLPNNTAIDNEYILNFTCSLLQLSNFHFCNLRTIACSRLSLLFVIQANNNFFLLLWISFEGPNEKNWLQNCREKAQTLTATAEKMCTHYHVQTYAVVNWRLHDACNNQSRAVDHIDRYWQLQLLTKRFKKTRQDSFG